jgi:hypothetical protein
MHDQVRHLHGFVIQHFHHAGPFANRFVNRHLTQLKVIRTLDWRKSSLKTLFSIYCFGL